MTDIFIAYSILYFNHLGWMVNKTLLHILFIQYSIYSFPPRQFQPLVHQEPSSCIQPDCGTSYWTSGWARAGGFDKKVWVWGSGAWYTAFYDSYFLRNLKALICGQRKFVDGVCHIWRYGIILLTPNIYRCIEHTIYIMAAHFIKKLNIRGLQSTKHALSQNNSATLQNGENLDDKYGKDFNIEMCMEAEASPTEADAILEAYSTDFVVGDTVGKLMAFISQMQASSEVTQVYLCELCQSNNCPTWEIKLWICTHWGSLSDCFCVVLGVQRVCTFVHFPILLLIFVCRLLIYSVFSLMKMKTSHPWQMAKIGATLSLLEQNGSLSSWLTTA